LINWLLNTLGFYLGLALLPVAILLPPAVLGWAGSQLLPGGGMIIGILAGFALSVPAMVHWHLVCQAFGHVFATVPCIPLRRKPSADELGWLRYFTAFIFLPFHVAVYAFLLCTTSPGAVDHSMRRLPLAERVLPWVTPTDAQFERLGIWSGGVDKAALMNRTFWEGYWPVHLGMAVCLGWLVVITLSLSIETIRRLISGASSYELSIDRRQHPHDLDLCEAVGELSFLGRVLYLLPPWLAFSSKRAARVVWGEPLWLLTFGLLLASAGIWFAGTLLVGAALRFEGAVQSHYRKRKERFGVVSELLRWLSLERQAEHRNSIASDLEAVRRRQGTFVK